MTDTSVISSPFEGFSKTLNNHGFGFQYAVARLAEDQYKPGVSPWRFPILEFPVQVQGKDTRIDIILQHYQRYILLVIECKRADPALSDWCFGRSPAKPWTAVKNQFFTECLVRTNAESPPSIQVQPLFSFDRIFDLALEVRGNKKGDSTGEGRGTIEKSATQVMRGVNGLIEFLKRHLSKTGETETIHLIPTIFTTARLWTYTGDLGTGDISTGKIELDAMSLEEADWLIYEYPQSPGLKHSLEHGALEDHGQRFAGALYSEFVRQIAVVNSKAISDFLKLQFFSF